MPGDDESAGGGPITPAEHVSAPVVPGTPLTVSQAMEQWRDEGFQSFKVLMEALARSGMIDDPMLHTVTFQVMGAYIYHLTNEFNEDIIEAHILAVSRVMANPNVSSMVEGMVKSQVDQAVRGMV